ncbi:MAG: type II secretion system F family protein [Pedosphaera sp.]|nr:type II secretion system F family protein [Pedosphaera sp.]
MPLFNYVALDKKGKSKEGTLEVANQQEAMARLKEMGFYPTEVVEAKPVAGKDGKSSGPKKKKEPFSLVIPSVGTKELATFTRQLATLVDAGLPLLRGMQVLAKQQKNPYLKKIVAGVTESIEGGSTFSEALYKFPKVFDKLYINMVKAGELGGVLEVTLNRLSEFMEKAQQIKGKVKAAMFYPVAVIIVATVIVGVLMVVVIPKFEQVFVDMLGEGEKLPDFTRLVLGISRAIKDNIFLTIGAVVGLFVTFKLITNKTVWGRYAWDKFTLIMPALGPVVSKVAISRFSRTLGTLVASGVPILQALNIVKETAGNMVVTRAIDAVYAAVKEGETITKPLEGSGIFPPMVVSMVDVGEQTGALPEMLIRIANVYDEEVDNAVSAMTALLEPIMIVFLGVIVGSIVIAMFLPLIVMMDKLGKN